MFHGLQTSSFDLGLSEFHTLSHQEFQGNVLSSVLIFLSRSPIGLSKPFSVKNVGVPFVNPMGSPPPLFSPTIKKLVGKNTLGFLLREDC